MTQDGVFSTPRLCLGMGRDPGGWHCPLAAFVTGARLESDLLGTDGATSHGHSQAPNPGLSPVPTLIKCHFGIIAPLSVAVPATSAVPRSLNVIFDTINTHRSLPLLLSLVFVTTGHAAPPFLTGMSSSRPLPEPKNPGTNLPTRFKTSPRHPRTMPGCSNRDNEL